MKAPKTVLVIDDDAAVLRIATARLEAEGIRVLTANNGAEGLRLAKEHIPDVIVLDLMMPGMHGYTVIQEIGLEPGSDPGQFRQNLCLRHRTDAPARGGSIFEQTI